MAAYEDTVNSLMRSRVIAVLRTADSTTALELVRAFIDGGMKAIELTTSIPNWEIVLEEAIRMQRDDACIGMGTIITAEDACKAVNLGAKFIVSPVVIPDVIASTHAMGVPVIPGALTPTEIHFAMSIGAEMVKVFPVSMVGGPLYIKALLAPMPDLKLIPTGGVKPGNAIDFLRAGAVAVGMGANLIPREALERRDWQEVSRGVAEFLANMSIALDGSDS